MNPYEKEEKDVIQSFSVKVVQLPWTRPIITKEPQNTKLPSCAGKPSAGFKKPEPLSDNNMFRTDNKQNSCS